MELIDFDGLFDEKLAEYMEMNQSKYTEKQWETVIPKLYQKFGDTYVAKVKCTPKEYYARMSNKELAETLLAHLSSDVPVPEFLCAELENRDAVEELLPLLDVVESYVLSYAINLIGDDARAYDKYFSVLINEDIDEDVRNDVADIFKLNADAVKERAFIYYQSGVAIEYMLEVLSRIKERDEKVYQALMTAFNTDDERIPMHASYLAAYGDVRALPVLLERIDDRTIGFVEFQELKYAIEALGGEYDEPRDFSADKDYLAVEAMGTGTGSQDSGLKS